MKNKGIGKKAGVFAMSLAVGMMMACGREEGNSIVTGPDEMILTDAADRVVKDESGYERWRVVDNIFIDMNVGFQIVIPDEWDITSEESINTINERILEADPNGGMLLFGATDPETEEGIHVSWNRIGSSSLLEDNQALMDNRAEFCESYLASHPEVADCSLETVTVLGKRYVWLINESTEGRFTGQISYSDGVGISVSAYSREDLDAIFPGLISEYIE